MDRVEQIWTLRQGADELDGRALFGPDVRRMRETADRMEREPDWKPDFLPTLLYSAQTADDLIQFAYLLGGPQ